MLDLVIDLIRAGQCLGDFFAKQPAEPLTQPVNSRLHRAFRDSQLGGNVTVRRVRVATGQEPLEQGELPSGSSLVLFPPEPIENTFEDGQRPPPLEDLFGRQPIDRLVAKSALDVVNVEGNHLRLSSPLPGPRLLAPL